MLAKGTLDLGGGPTTGADLVTAIRENRAYVNVHTEAHTTGEVRGQILSLNNRPPAMAEARGPSSIMISGDPADRLMSVSWLPVNDPDGDTVTLTAPTRPPRGAPCRDRTPPAAPVGRP